MRKFSTALAAMLVILGVTGCMSTRLQPTVDAAQAGESLRRADVADKVYELVYSARERAVLVAAPAGEEDAGAGVASKLLRLDPKTLEVQAEIELPYRGFGLALDDAAGRVYVGHGFDGAVSVVDIAVNRVIATMTLLPKIEGASARKPYAHSLRQLRLDPSGQRLYLPALANGGKPDSLLFVVDTGTLTLEKTIPGLGFEATGITADAAGQRLFVSNLQAQLITIDTQSLEIVKIAEIDADQPINIVSDAAGQRIYATDQGIGFRSGWRSKGLGKDMPARSEGHQVVVLDAGSGRTLARLPVDENPLSILLDESRKRLYVTNFNGIRVNHGKGTVAVFDSDSHVLLNVISLPPHPNSLALDAENNVLYVSVKNDGKRDREGLREGVVRIDLGALP